jgi:hypothetical protein
MNATLAFEWGSTIGDLLTEATRRFYRKLGYAEDARGPGPTVLAVNP